MPDYVVRQDPVEFTGRVADVVPSTVFSGVGLSTFVVEPDAAAQSLLTTRSGNTNPGGRIACTVGIDSSVVGWAELATVAANARDRKVRVVGTWCDDDDSGTTVIYPLGLLAIDYGLEVYDVDGWPVAVRDLGLFAFAHAGSPFPLLGNDPHAGESRTLTAHLPFPMAPSDTATPFWRAYSSTRIDLADAATFVEDTAGGSPELVATVDTGAPDDGKGFYAVEVALTFDEPDLDDFCPPGSCDKDGKHCAHEGHFRFMRVPPGVPYAKTGDLALSPGDGVGFISGIVASLEPPQVYDHMGIFVDNGWTIRHCTSSMERLEDESLFTAEISVKLAGVIELTNEKVPLNGFRPDLVRYGWPGSITQTVEEVYRTGRNSRNLSWTYAATHPGKDVEDPERPGVPFRIYHLPRAERQRRVAFNDPERDKPETLIRLQDTSVKLGDPLVEYTARLVRPHPQFELEARPALERVADAALKLNAHYRFFGYSSGAIGLDPAFAAPPAGDPSWAGLSPGAAWPADTIPAMCSSFVWTAVQRANAALPAGAKPILLEDEADAADPSTGLEYGARDGFYLYHADERLKAGKKLVAKIEKKIRDRFDDKIPGVAYAALPQLVLYREVTASNVGNQIANAFATDGCESLGDDWAGAADAETVSPDNTLEFWDLKPHLGRLVQPEGHVAVYGDSVPIILSAPQWKRVPLFRKQETNLGTGRVTGIATVAGQPVPGATVRFDFGCESATTTDNREIQWNVELGVGLHFADAFIVLPNPITGNPETFRTRQPLRFEIRRNHTTRIVLALEPPSDLWRLLDVFVDADIHDRSFWGGDADAHHFQDPNPIRTLDVRQDLEDDPAAPEDQQNTKLHDEAVWRTEPEVGSGVHVTVAIQADLDPSDRSITCTCDTALIDTDDGGFLGIGTSSNVDQLEHRVIRIKADETRDILRDVDFSSNETVPERAHVSVWATNRRRPG